MYKDNFEKVEDYLNHFREVVEDNHEVLYTLNVLRKSEVGDYDFIIIRNEAEKTTIMEVEDTSENIKEFYMAFQEVLGGNVEVVFDTDGEEE